ncbi:uncharacterized protein EKO05_0001776 [Ascochyta rabiei]|uniref:Uncharacterized protein n=1 Tax=Didymella rabiei TaxID=5454 RepID=A0A163BJI8_DIDRA|nr:uncharacterized protein EKO05_0001776 [Ascochyta rabiei]KZM21805.1 hypothetical protein ST47_g7174 [Ascochyta rabiei]UPX11154.1 hypothetical protein EKO05_0001776 [Ascochyta rabiei]
MNLNCKVNALAYPASDLSNPVSPCQCSVIFRCDDASKQATVLLVLRLPSICNTQVFVLQYDADSLLSGTVSLSSGNKLLPRPQLDDLLRDKVNKHFDIKTLALSIQKPCPLWCTDAQSFSPNPKYEQAFRQFVDLARSTTIHIVFDYKHIRKEHQGGFRAFCKAAKGLVGYPVEESLKKQKLRKTSWEIFGPVDAVEAPPPYDTSSARKRPRQASPTSPRQSPKRFAPQSPTESHSSERTVPFSPVTAAEALARALRKASPGFDFQTEAINAAVSKQLPAHLESIQTAVINAAIKEQLTAHLDKALQSEAMNTAIAKHLDTVLPTLLPTILDILLTGAPKTTPGSPATSFTSMDSHGNRHPKLPSLTPLSKKLIPHLRTHLAGQFRQYQAQQLQDFEKLVTKTLEQLEDAAYDVRARETAEFMGEMEEHKAEVSLLKRDTIQDLWRETEEVLARGKEEGWALGEDINERLSELCDKIERVKRVRLRKMVASEVSRQKQRKRGVPRGVGRGLASNDQRLLGRMREAEDVEWCDC